MIAGLFAASLATLALQDVEPNPTVWHFQAAACAGSAMLSIPEALPPGMTEAEAEVLAWSMVMAEYGRRAGRSEEQIEADAVAAREFFAELRRRDPEAFDAHRAYCRSIFP